jgi:hypothetical protein
MSNEKIKFDNGDVYEGGYDNGYLVGRGKYIRANGKVYDGFFTQSGSLFRAENSNGLQELGLADSE